MFHCQKCYLSVSVLVLLLLLSVSTLICVALQPRHNVKNRLLELRERERLGFWNKLYLQLVLKSLSAFDFPDALLNIIQWLWCWGRVGYEEGETGRERWQTSLDSETRRVLKQCQKLLVLSTVWMIPGSIFCEMRMWETQHHNLNALECMCVYKYSIEKCVFVSSDFVVRWKDSWPTGCGGSRINRERYSPLA